MTLIRNLDSWLVFLAEDDLRARVIAFVREFSPLVSGEPVAADLPGGAGVWLVGGCVRDWLLGRETYDLDLAVAQGGIQLARIVATAFGGAFFVLDEERDVGRAILSLHGSSAARGGAPYQEGTSRVLNVDVARLRAPELLDDLALRDFTINAMAIEVGRWDKPPHVIDPFDGRADLAAGLIRAVGEGAFRDDPLRTLRAVRQAAELHLRIEDATSLLIRRDAPLIASVAAERVRDELLRIVGAPGAWQHLRLLAQLDLLRPTLPEVAALIGIAQSFPHYQDVFDHTRSVMGHLEGIYALLWPEWGYARPSVIADDATVIIGDAYWAQLAEALSPYLGDLCAHLGQPLAAGHPRREGLMWAALAHDWGKPAMRAMEEGKRVRFLGHDRWGALLAQARGQALRLSADEITYLSRVVDQHMRPAELAYPYPPSRRAIYRFFRDVAGTGPDCILLSLADYMATWAPHPQFERWERRLKTAGLLLESYFRQRAERVEPAPLVDGHRIMAEFGLKPGPEIGHLLERLREAQAAGEVKSVEQALAWLAEHLGQDG